MTAFSNPDVGTDITAGPLTTAAAGNSSTYHPLAHVFGPAAAPWEDSADGADRNSPTGDDDDAKFRFNSDFG